MSSQAPPPSLVLTRRLADGTVEWVSLTIPDRVPAAPGAAYALIDRADYEAPQTLIAERQGNDLALEVNGNQVLMLGDFFVTDDVTFYPTTDIAGGGGPFTGSPLTSATPVLAGSPEGEQVVWAADGAQVAEAAEPESRPADQSDHGDGGTSPWLWGGLALGGLGLAAAAGGGGGGSGGSGGGSGGTDNPPPPPPPVQKSVAGVVVAGPVIEGNGLTVQVFAANGTTLLGEGRVGSDGSFTADIGDYSGVVIIRIVDADGGEDYLDEASAANQDLNAALSAVAATGSGDTVTVNLNPLTTLAAALAERTAGSTAPTQQQVADSNNAIATLFGLGSLHGVAVIPINGGAYDAADGISAGELYGAMLSAFSGATLNNGGDAQQTIDDVLAGLSLSGGTAQLNDAALQVLLQGAQTTEDETGESVSSVVSGTLDSAAPQITSGASAADIPENSGAGQVVYDAEATDDGPVTWSLKAGGDAAAFTIDASTGEVTLTNNPDFETKASYSFTVVATDAASNSSEQVVSLNITDQDDARPFITSLAVTDIDENNTANALVYTATATDQGPITWSLADSGDAALFSIDANSGQVRLSESADFETKSSYTFTVVATDNEDNASTQNVTLSINNVDEVAPTITSGAIASAINENSGANQLIYTAVADDSGDVSSGVTFTLGGPDASAFTIGASNGQVRLTANPNQEAKASYSFTVIATDGKSLSDSQAVTLSINDLDESAPNITSGGTATSINENSGANQLIYTAVADDSGDVSSGVTFTLGGPDASAFTIGASNGQVRITANPNQEAKASYSFTVIATDGVGLSDSQAVTLTINDVDEVAPDITSGSTATAINENSGANQLVYTATADDSGDISSGVTFTLGGADAAAFSVGASNGQVRLIANPDFEAKSSYSFTVIATDGAGLSDSQVVTLAINDVDDVAPTVTSGATAAAIDENSGSNQVVYTATATDAGTITWSLANSGDGNSFNINSNTGQVQLKGNPNFESKASYTFTVVATDDDDNSSQRTVTLAINNLDEADPVITSGSTVTPIAENSGPNQLVYTVVADDSNDISGGVTYGLAGADAGAFSIGPGNGQVRLTANPDAETKSSYNFTVTATDAAGNSDQQALTLTITDLDESAPTIVSPATANVDENVPTSFVVYTVTSTDNGDVSDGVTYSLASGGDASALTIDSDDGQVRLLASPDFETKSSYSFTVVATDGAGLSDSLAVTLSINDVVEADTSVVVFDLLNGASSDHSGRTFQGGVTYDIYIRVDSTDSNLDSNGGDWGTWNGVAALGSDDRVYLVGNGSPVQGQFGPVLSASAGPGAVSWFTTAAGRAGVLQGDGFTRITGSGGGGVDNAQLFNGALAASLDAGFLNAMPGGILTTQGLV